MYFPQNIKHLIDSSSWKNNSLAKELDLSPQQIGRYMSGDSQPKMETLIQIGKLFDLNVHDLILLDLRKEDGRPFDRSSEGKSIDEQTRELNKLLRQRVAVLERELKETNPDLARELGIE